MIFWRHARFGHFFFHFIRLLFAFFALAFARFAFARLAFLPGFRPELDDWLYGALSLVASPTGE
ncbi:MAG: hypothetical protein ACLP52_01760 [Streptosporangiaceae bacterium]